MARKKPAQIQWPLTPFSVESIDEMLDELYKRVALITEAGTGSSSGGGGTGASGPPGDAGADGADGAPGPPGSAGAAGSAGATGPIGMGIPGQDGEDAREWVVPGPQGVPGLSTRTTSMGITIDGGGSAITTGIKGDLVVPVACTIVSATLVADQSGSIVIDVWKDTYANYPPTVADTITASAKPTLSTAVKSQDTTLTGWTTAVAAGDTIRFNVDSASTVTRITLSLKVTVP